MASLNIPNSFSNNTVADATQVNANFTSVKNFAESAVVQVDGSVKAPTVAIADGAVTAVKIADGAVTASKLPANTFAVTYQDHTISGLTQDFLGQWVTADTKITLTGGKTYQNVIGVTCLGGLNAYGTYAYFRGIGLQSGVLNANEVIVQAAVSNNAANGNYAIVRVWTTA